MARTRHQNSAPLLPPLSPSGLPTRPEYFPIAVWLQGPQNAVRYKAAGINLYVGLWQGPTDDQLAALKRAGMPVVCDQNEIGLAHKDDPIIVGWMHGDEPDNAQPVTDTASGKKGYGPPIAPAKIVADYQKLRQRDPGRPVLLNLGQGVANDAWVGRGPDASPDDYPKYVVGCDIVSFDVYPVAGLNKPDGENYLWYVAQGVERLARYSKGKKRIWNCIEVSGIDSGKKPTPAHVRAEVWMSLVHGSTGLIYFTHEWKPRFNEHALLDDPLLLPAVTALNRQITQLAPVINSPNAAGAVTVASSTAAVPVAQMTKRYGGAMYIFAVGMRNAPTKATFTLAGNSGVRRVDVLDDRQGVLRTIEVRGSRFDDDFGPYDTRLYRLR